MSEFFGSTFSYFSGNLASQAATTHDVDLGEAGRATLFNSPAIVSGLGLPGVVSKNAAVTSYGVLAEYANDYLHDREHYNPEDNLWDQIGIDEKPTFTYEEYHVDPGDSGLNLDYQF